jgi:hypothetical protein
MRRHTRLRAGLLALSVGAAVLSMRPARTQTDLPPAPPPQAPPTPAPEPPAAEDAAKDEGPRVTQQLWVNFPKAGRVHVRAIEDFGEQMRIEVLDVETEALLYSFPAPAEERPEAGYIANPFLRFAVVRRGGLPRPLILAVAVTPGVSGHGFSASLIGEVGGRLKILTPAPLATDNQGGVHVGDLGGGRGAGVAVWTPIWDTGCEGHYSAHRFEVEHYPFDTRRGRFIRGRTVRSVGKYGRHGEGALEELGLRYTDLLQDMPDVSAYHWL